MTPAEYLKKHIPVYATKLLLRQVYCGLTQVLFDGSYQCYAMLAEAWYPISQRNKSLLWAFSWVKIRTAAHLIVLCLASGHDSSPSFKVFFLSVTMNRRTVRGG